MLHGSSGSSGSWWEWERGCHTKVWMADVESSQSLRESICRPIKTTHSLSFPRPFQGALAPRPPELPWQCIPCVSWPLFWAHIQKDSAQRLPPSKQLLFLPPILTSETWQQNLKPGCRPVGVHSHILLCTLHHQREACATKTTIPHPIIPISFPRPWFLCEPACVSQLESESASTRTS